MKILFATYEGVTLYRGGPYVKIIESRRHLEALGVQVGLFDLWSGEEGLAGYDLVHLFGGNLAVYNLARNLKSRGIPYVVNPIFFTRHRIPLVRTVSAIDRLGRRWVPGLWWDYGFTRDICAWAEAVLPNTQAEARLIEKGLGIPAGKIQVIPNGVSARFLEGDAHLFERRYGLKNFILTVGHMGPPRKNILSLVRALAQIDHPAVIIARTMNMGETPQILKEARRNPRLLIIDGLDHQSDLLAAAYAACDVFVLPSQFETPGRAALEAGLAGAPVVITPHGGTRDYFADMAGYVNPKSVKSIRRGIEQALQQPRSDRLREHIRANFLWEKVAEKTMQTYRKVLNR